MKELTYTVKPNDTLWLIAHRYQITVDELIKQNKHIDPPNLCVGQKLNIKF